MGTQSGDCRGQAIVGSYGALNTILSTEEKREDISTTGERRELISKTLTIERPALEEGKYTSLYYHFPKYFP